MVRIEDRARMNPWWVLGEKFADSDKDLAKLNSGVFRFQRRSIDFKPGGIYIIKGPRRVGKTLLLKMLILNLLKKGADRLSIFYYSLDSIKSAKELSNMLYDFFDNLGLGTRYIMLDEVQNVEGWENVVQALANEGMLKNTVTVVTGSLAHVLRQELMPGRGTEGNTYIMRTLTFGDFCSNLISVFAKINYGSNKSDIKEEIGHLQGFLKPETRWLIAALGDDIDTYADGLMRALGKRISLEESTDEIYASVNALVPYAVVLKKLFSIYMRTGGYPISINSYFQELPGKPAFSIAQQVYEELYLYAKNDASTMAGTGRAGNPSFAEGVLQGALSGIGKSISYTKLSRQASMNTKTFIEYSRRLRESYVFLTLNGLDKKLEPLRLQKSYFCDLMLHYSVGSYRTGEEPNRYAESILNSDSVGIAIEEIVASHLSQAKEDDPMRRYDTYLYFLKGEKELDFIYRRDDGSHLGIEIKYQNSVSEKNDLYRIKGIDHYLIVSKDTLERGEHSITVPAYLLLAALGKSSKDL